MERGNKMIDKIEYSIIRLIFAISGAGCFMSAELATQNIMKFIWYFGAIAMISIISASIAEQHFQHKL
jgi:NADH:ubiquinone oxidoreductase subunit 6 (subunit J)